MNEQAIFIAALQHQRDQRAAYLDAACGDDRALRGRVEVLLAAHEKAGSFMQQPAAGGFTEAYRPISEGPGTVIGPYKLLQQIGEGGFGIVYMAEQLEPVRRKVALKIIKPGMDTKEVIARFESERQALALMDHPNVARVFDAGATDTSRPYFVMELVRGVPITEFCDKNLLPTAGRLDLFRAVCRAVQHAHQKGIIHRDLKPSNILVTLHDGQPVPKVIDFGVAKATSQQLTQRTLFTAFGQMVGTPAYMSPEQAEMSGLDIDTRSDIYSLGVLLYELLTGTTPLESKRLREAGYAEMQRLIREEEPPRPSIRLSSLGGEATVLAGHRGTDVRRLAQLLRGDLDWIVMKALEKDRNRRYETPGAFAADVERFLQNEPIVARPPSALYRLRKFARRNRAAVLVAAVMLVLLVVGITGTSIGLVWAVNAEADARNAQTDAQVDAMRARDAEKLAEQRLIDVKHERDGATRARAQLQDTFAREESRRLAAESLVVRADNPGLALLLAVAGAKKAPVRAAPHNNALLAALRECREERTWFAPPFQSPQGRTGRTAFLSVRVTPHGTRAVAVGVRFNDPGSDEHFAEDKTDSAYVYDLATGKVTATMRLPGVWFAMMAISPDGRLLAAVPNRTVVVRYKDGQFAAYTEQAVRLWDMATGTEVRVLTGHTERIASLAFDARGERLVTASLDKTARIWDVATGKTLHVLAGHKTSLETAEFSPDGRHVLTVPTNDVRTGPSVVGSGGRTTGAGRAFPVAQTAIDPPTRTDAGIDWIDSMLQMSSTGAAGMQAPCLWDAASGKRRAVLDAAGSDGAYYGGVLYTAGFSPDSQRVAVTRHDKIQLWNTADGTPIQHRSIVGVGANQLIEDGDRRLRIVRASLAAPGLLVWQSAKDPQGWQRSGAAVRRSWMSAEGDGPTRFLDSNRDGPPLIAVATGDRVSIRTLGDDSEVAALRGHDGRVTAAAFLPGGTRIVTTAMDGTVRLWNLASSGNPVVEMRPTSAAPVGHAAFVKGGKQVIAAPARDRFSNFAGPSVWLWDAATGTLIHELVNAKSSATSELHMQLLGELRDLDVTADGTRLVTVHADFYPCSDPRAEPQPHPLYTPVRLWDLRTGKRLFALAGLRRGVAAARFSPDGRRLVTLSDGRHQYAILRDGKRFAVGDEGPHRVRVDLWDSQTGKHLRNLVPDATVHSYFALTPWSRDSTRILTDCLFQVGKSAAILDVETGERLGMLALSANPTGAIDHGGFSPDGKYVLGYRKLYNDKRELVEVWDTATGALRCTLRGHTGDVTSAQFSHDSQRILTTSTDGTARLWDAATGQERHVLHGHRNIVRAGRMSPDGKWAVTASVDGTARIWSTATGEEWLTLPVAAKEVVGVEFSPDSARILTVSADGAARIWPVDPLPLAAGRTARALTAAEQARFQVQP